MRIIDHDQDTGSTLRTDFDGVSETVDYVDSGKVRCTANRPGWEKYSFDGSPSDMDKRDRAWLDSAIQHGDSETLDAIARVRERIESGTPIFSRSLPRRVRLRDQDFGDNMIPDRFLARKDLMPRGAAICAIADWLTQQGYSVQITAVWYSTNMYRTGKLTRIVPKGSRGKGYLSDRGSDDESALISMLVKPAQVPLDVASVATACCEIAFARAVMLRSRFISAARPVVDFIGKATVLPTHKRIALGLDVTIPANIMTEEQAIAWLNSTVAVLTGTAPESQAV